MRNAIDFFPNTDEDSDDEVPPKRAVLEEAVTPNTFLLATPIKRSPHIELFLITDTENVFIAHVALPKKVKSDVIETIYVEEATLEIAVRCTYRQIRQWTCTLNLSSIASHGLRPSWRESSEQLYPYQLVEAPIHGCRLRWYSMKGYATRWNPKTWQKQQVVGMTNKRGCLVISYRDIKNKGDYTLSDCPVMMFDGHTKEVKSLVCTEMKDVIALTKCFFVPRVGFVSSHMRVVYAIDGNCLVKVPIPAPMAHICDHIPTSSLARIAAFVSFHQSI